MEVESALVDHPAVAEAAVVGIAHEIKGTGDRGVRHREGVAPRTALDDPALRAGAASEHVAQKIGAIARPEKILFTADLPKTRSGKIMRRLLRDIAEGRALGDMTTLADPTVVASLKDKYEEEAERGAPSERVVSRLRSRSTRALWHALAAPFAMPRCAQDGLRQSSSPAAPRHRPRDRERLLADGWSVAFTWMSSQMRRESRRTGMRRNRGGRADE